MSTNTLPSSRTAADQLWTELQDVTAIDHFRDGVNEDDVTYDDDEKAHGYAVLWTGSGSTLTNRICRTPDAKSITFQITAVGGDGNRARWVADKIQAAFSGLRLTLPDGITTPIRQDNDPGFPQEDDDVNPPRYQLPLVFTCRLAPA